MKSITELAPPELDMPEQDGDLLRELAETLTVHNIQQYNTLLKTKDGFADSRRWKEVRRKDGVRVYRERSHHNGLPSTPSLLLLGTIEGKLDDVMYGAVATTDEAIRIKSTSFGFLGANHKSCKSCLREVCSRCCSKQLVCIVAPDQRTVLGKKRSFCTTCLADAANCDALEVAREELASSKAYREACLVKAQEMARTSGASFMHSAVSRRSRINSRSQIGRNSMAA
ncbi:hypothetical protein PC128_g15292 [Phytophthora cactorum]|uniref:Uncharacterized protein n=1 Tax=Phytophthora cactorum TaxID=29920 RepID=A0A8T1B484_9STRA|nr:hypothetical protein PC115_g18666 [Phytophthora cactorum]KAG3181072.1 hypothetical protein PC128_g15292 [Phytophthora cactorum]